MENFVGYVGYQPPLNAVSAKGLIADETIPPGLATALVSREAYANGNAYLTLTAPGERRWQTAWADFRSG